MAQVAQVKQVRQKELDDEWTVEPVTEGDWVVEPINADPHPQNPPQPLSAHETTVGDIVRGGLSEAWRNTKALGTAILNPTQNFPGPVETGMGAEAGFLGMAVPSKVFSAGAGGLEMLRAGEGATKATSLGEQVMASPIGGALSKLSKVKAARAIEQKMAPSGVEAKLGAERIAPELAQNPELARVKAARFTQKLHEQYKIAGAQVHAAEQSVPRTTRIPQSAITDGLETIIEEYRDMGATEAASAVAREWEKWAAKDANISWDDFIATKRRLGTQMETMGQFRESGTAAERATGQAMKEAYRIVADAGNVSPELTAANHQYWLMNSAMEDAGVSFRSGRKIAEIGKPPAPGLIKRTVKKAAPYAIGGGITGIIGRELLSE